MQSRQGDVFWTRCTGPIPARTTTLTPDGDRYILARGEVTGHHHSFPATAGSLWQDASGTTYMTIEELTAVEHQEHAAIPVEPATYRVTRQREYAGPERQQWVGD
jgi:hypothetical protein